MSRLLRPVMAAAVCLLPLPALAGFAGTDVLVPLVGYGSGPPPSESPAPVSLDLTNHSTSANALVYVELYEYDAASNPTATTKLVLGPGETSTISDPLGSLFGLATAEGALRLVSTTEVLAAIHAKANESDTTGGAGAGAGYEGVPASFAIASGQTTNLLGVAETRTQDYHFSAIETAGVPVTILVSLANGAGQVVASRSYDLPPHGAMERSVTDLSPLPFTLASGLLKVEVTGGDGSVLAYGMRVDTLSENASGFAMSFDDSLLVSPFTAVTSLNQLKGDLTLQGSGTVTITTTPNGGGQQGGTITVDTPAYTAGTGLDLSGNQFSLLPTYSLPQACASGQVASWNGTSWGCVGLAAGATSPNLKWVGELNWWGGKYSGGSYGFNEPWAVAFDGAHIWVTNYWGDSVTEMNASDGTWVRTLSGGSYGFHSPGGVAFDGAHIWVTNHYGNSVTEINASDGSWVRTLSGGSYGFNHPEGVAFDGTHIWVTNPAGNSATEINAADGSWTRTLSGGSYGFNHPEGVAFDGTHIWVANYSGNSVTEINASDGSWVRTLSGGSYGFYAPEAVAFDGTHIWVTNYSGNSVTEINASDGSWVRTLSGGPYGFYRPWGVAFDGAHIWVVNVWGNSVTEINAADGSWIRTLSGSSYGLSAPLGVAFDGAHIWVANQDSVTEVLTH